MIVFLQKHKWILSVILAILSGASLPFYSVAVAGLPLWGKLLCCAAAGAAAFFLLSKGFSHVTTRLFWFSTLGGCVLALFSTVGKQLYLEQHFALTVGNLLWTLAISLAACPFYGAVLAFLLDGIPSWRDKLNKGRLNAWRFQPANLKGAGGFFLLWGVLLLFWLPAFLGFFPGIWGYDMHNQTYQILTHHYNNFQPLLHTLLYEVTYRAGLALFGSPTAGVATFTFVQMLLMSACLSGVILYLAKRLRAPAWISLLAVAFYALLPFHAILSVSSTKDTVFAGMFLITVIQVYDLCLDPAGFLKSIRRMVLLILSIVAICLLRNNTLYALLFLLPFLVLGIKEKRLWIGALMIVALAAAVFAKGALTTAVDAGDGRRIEMLSIPIQQVARTYTLHKDELTPKTRAAVTEYLPEDVVENYYPFLADPVKDHCNIGDGAPSIKGFLSLWVDLMKQYPGDYVDAFLLMNLGYWYPEETFHSHIYDCYEEPDTEETLGYMYTGFVENINEDVHKSSLWPGAENYYNWFAHKNSHEAIPGLRLLFAPGFYCWILYFTMLALLYFRAYRLLWPLMLPLGVWLTLLLGPCLVVRYAYPIMAATPLLAGVLFNGREGFLLTQPTERRAQGGRGGEVIRFAVSGGVGFVIDYGLMVLLKEAWGMHYLLATGLGFAVSVVVNYLLCAYWVFNSADTRKGGVKLAFIITSVIGLALNEGFMFLFVDVMQLHYMLAKIIAVILVMIWNYFSKRKVLTGKEKRTEETA